MAPAPNRRETGIIGVKPAPNWLQTGVAICIITISHIDILVSHGHGVGARRDVAACRSGLPFRSSQRLRGPPRVCTLQRGKIMNSSQDHGKIVTYTQFQGMCLQDTILCPTGHVCEIFLNLNRPLNLNHNGNH